VKPVRLSPEAVDELVEASGWYAAQRPGLESGFLLEVERVLAIVEASPMSFPRLLDAPPDLAIRSALLPRFPYALVFMELEHESRVLAVAHAKRRPGYWLGRVQP
jgi:toxin ParE1/3/4